MHTPRGVPNGDHKAVLKELQRLGPLGYQVAGTLLPSGKHHGLGRSAIMPEGF